MTTSSFLKTHRFFFENRFSRLWDYPYNITNSQSLPFYKITIEYIFTLYKLPRPTVISTIQHIGCKQHSSTFLFVNVNKNKSPVFHFIAICMIVLTKQSNFNFYEQFLRGRYVTQNTFKICFTFKLWELLLIFLHFIWEQ